MPDTRINQTALLQLLENLIQINSVNPSLSDRGAGEADIARYIGAYLDKLGLAGFGYFGPDRHSDRYYGSIRRRRSRGCRICGCGFGHDDRPGFGSIDH